MKNLTRDEIISAVKSVRGGTITRVTYRTDVPIKAEFKKKGYKIIKIVETSARIGVNYGHISSVVNRDKMNNVESTSKTNNFEWIVKDRICHNTNTNKDYVALISFNKGHNTRVKYIIEGTFVGAIDMGSEIDKAYRHIVLDSYFKKPSTPIEFRRVSFDNIIRINNVGTKLAFN